MDDDASAGDQGAPEPLSFDGEDVLRLAVRHLGACPAPVTLLLQLPGLKHELLWTSSRARYAAAPHEQRAAFSPLELEALAGAYVRDRLVPGLLLEAATRKLREPGFRVTAAIACGGVVPQAPAVQPTWVAPGGGIPGHWARHGTTLGQLARYLGARLVAVEFDAREAA